MNKKLIYQVLAGLIGAIIFGIAGLFFLMNYGGNNCDQPPTSTCECFCCNLFNSRGYEACSQLGLYIGALIGIIIGVSLYRINWQKLFKLDKK